MTPEIVMDIGRQAVEMTLLLSAPLLLAALVIGLIVSVFQAATQINETTQKNASASEELAATAEEMGGQAEQLQELMDFFRIDEDGHRVSASWAA